ncbi:MAG: hypothetical protein CM1200mP18_02290 [Gammaproteobacteria bacterium]|nr:MAG: hypothetical protein CM1200mP18_02290 [Gammaproteobacteria bacterium]
MQGTGYRRCPIVHQGTGPSGFPQGDGKTGTFAGGPVLRCCCIRCREGDLDGIEVEAYGHLFDSFWSPGLNHRADRYGGSLENRMRFGIEVLQEIRRQVGDDYIVGIRMVF